MTLTGVPLHETQLSLYTHRANSFGLRRCGINIAKGFRTLELACPTGGHNLNPGGTTNASL